MEEKLFTVELIFRTVIRGTKESVLREAEEMSQIYHIKRRAKEYNKEL